MTQFKTGHLVLAKHPEAKTFGNNPIRLKPNHVRMFNRETPGIVLKPVDLTVEFLTLHGFEHDIQLEPGDTSKALNLYVRKNVVIEFQGRDRFFFLGHKATRSPICFEHQVQDLCEILNAETL